MVCMAAAMVTFWHVRPRENHEETNDDARRETLETTRANVNDENGAEVNNSFIVAEAFNPRVRHTRDAGI